MISLEVHLFLEAMEEHAQGMKDICDPCIKWNGIAKGLENLSMV